MEGRRIYVKHPSYYSGPLIHSGTKGMHWGERLYQYEDGSLTPLGRIHYGIGKARARRIEQANEKARIKAEQTEKREKQKYQHEDGTLTLRGKVKYGTTDKYALLTDDELRQQTNRLQLQKNLEQLKKDTSASYRLKNRIGNMAEDVTVSGMRKIAEKVANSLADKAISEILGVDKDKAEKVRQFTEKMANMKTNEIESENKRKRAEAQAYKLEFGSEPPKDYQYTDFTKSEKEGLEKANRSAEQNNQNSPSKSSEQKTVEEKPKPSEQKTETKKNEKENNVSEKKTEEKPESAAKTGTVKVSRTSESDKDRALRAYNAKYDAYKTPEIPKRRINSLRNSGMTIKEIAEKLDISPSTVEKILKG